MPEDVLSVELSSVMILHPRVLNVHLSFRVIILFLPEIQDLPSRGTYAMLLLANLLSLIFILFMKVRA